MGQREADTSASYCVSRRSLRYVITFITLSYYLTDAAPPNNRQFGPCIGMDCLHGVLMHNDDAPGDDHKNQDIFDKLQKQDEVRGQKLGPDDAMTELHGAMMHGGEDADTVEKIHQEMQGQVGPEERKSAGPKDGMSELHGVMMHGDDTQGINHAHQDAKAAADTEQGHQVGPDLDGLHGVLMHGDQAPGHDHAAEDDKLRQSQHEGKQSGIRSPEEMMHGEDADFVHHPDNVHDIDPKHKGVPSVGDLHAVIHGEVNAKMETVTLGEATPEDAGDFAKWQKKDDENNAGWGFTFPFISDSILNELELMKRRYLSRFWASEEDTIAYREKDRRLEKPETHDVMDDVAAVGDTGPVPHFHDEVTSGDKSRDKPRRDL